MKVPKFTEVVRKINKWFDFARSHPQIYAPLIVLFLLAIVYFAMLATPLNLRNLNRIVTIQPNASLQEIATYLQDQNIIENRSRFILATKMMRKGRKLRAGRFNLKRASNYYELIKTLSDWEVETVRVTIPEGLRSREIAKLLEKRIGVSAEGFMKKIMDPNFTHELGIAADNLEGYLFPDSYDLLEGDSPEYVIRRMVSRFKEVVNDSVRQEIKRRGYNLHQVITLASIVEGEVQVNFERPIVASLYYNRLRRRIRLEACPTIQYIIPDSPRRLLMSDLKIKSPYNTYLHYGLPPGPVSNPGWKSIQATLNPAKTNYLYMISKGDSTYTHIFTSNYNEFLAAKKRLQNIRKQNKLNAGKDYVD